MSDRCLPAALSDQLLEQRRVLVSGALGPGTVTDVAARLMTLDGTASTDVELMVTSPGGAVTDGFAILDVLGLMRARVNVTATGSVAGTAVAVVAACSGERRAAPHATFSFAVEPARSIEGTAHEVAARACEEAAARSRYVRALSEATGHDERSLLDLIDDRRHHTAEEALALGVVDTIATRR